MQRRLFTLFLLLSMLPAALVLLADWHLSQRHLDFLDSPGLRRSLESSLDLARAELDRRLDFAAAQLDSLDVGDLDAPPVGSVLILLPDDGPARATPAAEAEVLAAVGMADTKGRITVGERQWLVAQRPVEGGRLALARPLPAEIEASLEAVSQGSARLRQMSLYYRDLLRGDTLLTLGVLGLVLLVISLLLSRYFARRIARPVGALAEGTRRVAEGDLEHRVDVDAPDELGQLVTAFNRMTDDLRLSKADLVRAERVAAWRGVARRLAHEIKNPLTPITLAMHRIGKRSEDETVADAVSTVLEETENLKRLADEFSQYARLPEPHFTEVDLREVAQGVVDLYAGSTRVDWRSWREPIRVDADPGQLRQAFGNLVRNAVQAAGTSGALTLTLRREDAAVLIDVADDGPGLPDDCESVFEPYFTTRETGTGLGLPIARRIVEDHGGSLTAANAPGGGAVFSLRLPIRRTPKESS